MARVFLSLGSNLGDRRGFLEQALRLLGDHEAVRVITCSQVYETEPWPEVRVERARWYLNCAVEIEMADGSKLSAFCEHPRGSHENPLTRAQIEDKFRTYAKGVLTDANAEEVIAAIGRLEEFTSVRKLMDLLRGAARAARGERAA